MVLSKPPTVLEQVLFHQLLELAAVPKLRVLLYCLRVHQPEFPGFLELVEQEANESGLELLADRERTPRLDIGYQFVQESAEMHLA